MATKRLLTLRVPVKAVPHGGAVEIQQKEDVAILSLSKGDRRLFLDLTWEELAQVIAAMVDVTKERELSEGNES